MSNDSGVSRASAVVSHVVSSIVDNPAAVSVSVDESVTPIRLNVEVEKSDMGRVIGRRGRVANAIRAVGRAAASADDELEIDVEFVD